MGIPNCSVCGMPCLEHCSDSDEFGNPVGDWCHIVCKAREPYSGSVDDFGSLSNPRLPSKKKASVYHMRLPFGRMGTPVRKTLFQMQKRNSKVRKGQGCHRF
jgi:hypothetical protein